MENALLILCCFIAIGYMKRKISWILAINFILCGFSAHTMNIPNDWRKKSRPYSKLAILHSPIIPLITSYIEIENHECVTLGSVLVSFLFLTVFSNFSTKLKLFIGGIFVSAHALWWNLNNYDCAYCLFIYQTILFSLSFCICFFGCAQSFSVVEATLIAQLIAGFFASTLNYSYNKPGLITIAILLGHCVGLLCFFVATGFMFCEESSSRMLYFYIVIVFLVVKLLLFNFESVHLQLIFLVQFFTNNYALHSTVLLCWFAVIFACFIYTYKRKSNSKASTAERKVFHLFILLVYVPGILFDIPLLFFCSVVVFCVFVVTAIFHAFQIRPVGPWLDETFTVFSGKQDSGNFVLTPIYLLLGLSLPVWLSFIIQDTGPLHTNKKPIPVQYFSGVLSVGIGDAFASVVGSKYGSIKIPGTGKTLEGAVASILSQLLFVAIMSHFLVIEISLGYMFAVICIVALVEVYTDQIDNLVLPILMHLLLIPS